MKIISGAQTGADRAGLDVAIDLGLDYGGSLPKGRLTEEGPLDPKYDRMTELDSPSYPKRTLKNVLDPDATLLFTVGKISGGTALTLRRAKEHGKPYLHINLESQSEDRAVQVVSSWLDQVKPGVLNVAGSRESKSPGVYGRVYRVLRKSVKRSLGNQIDSQTFALNNTGL